MDAVGWDFPRGTASVSLLVRYGIDRGVEAGVLLAGSALTVDDLDDPSVQIDARDELTVVGNLVAAVGNPAGLGIDVGCRYRVTTFGIFGFAMISSPTLGDAIALALGYLELSFAFCIPTATVDGDELVGTVCDDHLPPELREFLVERDVAAMYTVLCDLLGGRRLRLNHIMFRLPRPARTDAFSAVFGREPEFEADRTGFTFAAEQLGVSLPQANSSTWALCREQCRELVARRRTRTGIAHVVRDKLVRLGGAPAGIDEVATDLGMSTRTLRRKLTDAGTTYRALLDEVREAIAEEMLATTPMSVSDIAISLGYAEASTFIHAFKRWKGVTPAAYQRSRR